MARNGAGTYQLPAGQPVVTGTTISSATHNTLANDLANALTTSIATDGQSVVTGNIPFAGYKLTGVGAATVNGDALRFENLATLATSGGIQDQTYTAFTTGGTSTAYTLTPVPAITAYVVGQAFDITLHTAAGASPTININGLGATVNLVYRNAAGAYVNINGLPAGVYRGVMVSTTQMMLNAPIGLLQRVQFSTSTPATGTTRVPITTSAPTNAQGDQYLSQAFTAKSASSKVKVSVDMCFLCSVTGNTVFTIFKDGVFVCSSVRANATAGSLDRMVFGLEIPAGDLSSHTYTVRAGMDLVTFTFGMGSTLLGGALVSSLTIEEFLP